MEVTAFTVYGFTKLLISLKVRFGPGYVTISLMNCQMRELTWYVKWDDNNEIKNTWEKLVNSGTLKTK